MASFLDRVVARAKGRGAPVQPRFAHRFAQPDHHLAPAPPDSRRDDHESGREGARDLPRAPEPAGDRGTAHAAEAQGATVASFEPQQLRFGWQADGMPGAAEGNGRRALSRLDDAAGERQPLPGVERARDARGELPGTPVPRPASISNATVPGGRPPPERALVPRTPPGAPHTGAVSLPGARGAADGAGDARGEPAAASGRARLARGAAEDAFWKFLYGTSSDDASAPSLPPLGRAELGGAATQPRLAAEAPGADRGRAAEAPAAEITISIDRIDVRGLAPPPAPARGAAPARRTPRMSLADYMSAQRPGGSRR
jgi:hypothetical protein